MPCLLRGNLTRATGETIAGGPIFVVRSEWIVTFAE
jgi:hypothetical protein